MIMFRLLMILIVANLNVDSKVITVNNDGDTSIECCVNGTCPCSSLYYALQHLTSNSIINITSESVTLNITTLIGSGVLHNITITGNGATVVCSHNVTAFCGTRCHNNGGRGLSCRNTCNNYSGIVYCPLCTDVTIKGITWDQCNTFHISDVNIIDCVFQFSKESRFDLGTMSVQRSLHISNSKFLIKNATKCTNAVKQIMHHDVDEEFVVSITNSTFNCFQFGIYGASSISIYSSNFTKNSSLAVLMKLSGSSNSSIAHINNAIFQESFNVLRLIDATSVSIIDATFFSNAGTAFYMQNSNGRSMSVTLSNVLFKENKAPDGCVIIYTPQSLDSLHINLSEVKFDVNEYYGQSETTGILTIETGEVINKEDFKINLTQCRFFNNTSINGPVFHMLTRSSSSQIPLWLSSCNFCSNTGGKSITYFENSRISVTSSNFIGNDGSALYLSSCFLDVYHQIKFENNSAYNGAAIYVKVNRYDTSTIRACTNCRMEFINNNARYNGGAIYVDLSARILGYYNGIPVFELLNETAFIFINNSAGSAGNAVYLRFQKSLNVQVQESMMNFISRLSFNQSITTVVPPYATSPNKVQLCSSAPCNATNTNNSCSISEKKMFGQSVNFNATICDYFNQSTGEVQFHMNCVNCGIKYKLNNNGLIVGNQTEVSFVIKSSNSIDSIASDDTLMIDMFSILPPELKQLSATLSVNLSPCFGGFKFSNHTKICECYNDDNDIIQCDGVNAEIRQGYWFGSVVGKRTVSLCPNFYCEFSDRTETGNGYYNLPRELDDQCRPHRTGVACGECSSGYTLAYNAPDCVDERKCSWMLPLVIVLTILYWIVIVVGVCGLMHSKFQISLGHLYGIIYYYSIVGVLLGNDLFISDGVFQLVAVISSFAKLTPQIIGKLCFVKGLSGIDQQFINYIHVIAVSLMLFGISRAAKYSRRIANFGQHFIVRAVCVLLLLSYTSLASTSLQLLRPLTFNDVDGTFSYSSPDVKYFSGRHVVHGIVAILCLVGFVVSFPCLLMLEPLLKRKFSLSKSNHC